MESVMPSNHLILCHPLLLLPSIFPSIRVFSNESGIHIRWPKYWSSNFSISSSNEYSGLISFRMDWFDLIGVQGTLKSLLQHHSLEASILQRLFSIAIIIIIFCTYYLIGSYFWQIFDFLSLIREVSLCIFDFVFLSFWGEFLKILLILTSSQDNGRLYSWIFMRLRRWWWACAQLVRHVLGIHPTPHPKVMDGTLWAGPRTPYTLDGPKWTLKRTYYSFPAQPKSHYAPRHSTNCDKLFFKTKVGV